MCNFDLSIITGWWDQNQSNSVIHKYLQASWIMAGVQVVILVTSWGKQGRAAVKQSMVLFLQFFWASILYRDSSLANSVAAWEAVLHVPATFFRQSKVFFSDLSRVSTVSLQITWWLQYKITHRFNSMPMGLFPKLSTGCIQWRTWYRSGDDRVVLGRDSANSSLDQQLSLVCPVCY